jgi:hypothetical protein
MAVVPVTIPDGFELETALEPQQAAGPAIPPGFQLERDFGIDFTRPIPEVRAAVAELPETDRPHALRQWADAYVRREQEANQAAATREAGGHGFADWMFATARQGPRTAGALVRQTARGTFVGPWLDELNALTSAGIHGLTGGSAGAPYDEAVAYQRALDRAQDQETGWAGTGMQVGGALAGGGAAYNAARRLGLPSIMGQTLPRQMAAGAALVGPAHAFNYAAGVSEGTPEQRMGEGTWAIPMGVLGGIVAPPVLRGIGAGAQAAYNFASPTLARIGATLSPENLRNRLGIRLSADGAATPETAGATAAGEQTIANAMVSGGVTPARLRTFYGDEFTPGSVDYARRMNSNSYGQDVTTLAEAGGNTTQRLLGKAVRRSTEAAELTGNILQARQTGVTPAGASAQTLAEMGFPTSPNLARPETGAQMERRLGSRFGTPAENFVPRGQFERIMDDGLRRAILLEAQQHHGQMLTGRMTEEAILAAARREGQILYRQAYKAGGERPLGSMGPRRDVVPIAPAIEPQIAKWERAIVRESPDMQRDFAQLFKNFRTTNSLEHFDRMKRRLLDDKINTAARQGDDYLVMRLTQFKNDLLRAVDTIPTRDVGPLYAQARQAWGSRQEAVKDLRTGRDAWKEGSEIGVANMQAAEHPKLVLHGFHLGARDAGERGLSGADRLALLDTPRMRSILSHIIPRTETPTGRAKVGATFADRPQRYGSYLQNEALMIQTRNKAIGGSPTAERTGDDAAFKALTSISEVFHTRGLKAAAMRTVDKALSQIFGMAHDVSVSVARQLLTANPVERQKIMERIIARMGANRAAQFAGYLQQHQAMLTGSATRGVTPSGP